MSTRCCPRAAALVMGLLCFVTTATAGPVVRFFAIGDTPYGPGERLLLESMLAQELQNRPPFLVHAGDIKGGFAACTDASLQRVAELFRDQPVPVIYTPGDNEWTDCHRPVAGGYDPLERLAMLRRLFYGDAGVLRLKSLGVRRTDDSYPENLFFVHEGVLFATVHVVGSSNNLRPSDAAATAEFAARLAANRRHLRHAVEAAGAADASAFVLIFHSSSGLDSTSIPKCFKPFREDLNWLLQHYRGPVLAVHGDNHVYRFDHPLTSPATGKPERRFTRLEVPGSPTVAGVWVVVDPAAAEPFSAELVYPGSRDVVMQE